ncbi:MAG: ABC transporter permease subunit [Candidatus Eisenbacteria bacterium]|nr:ABC transporter permease subunit [Candidatus Eisenbacteria bacterium]
MNRVAAIAANTFREALRQRVLYLSVGFMLFLFAAAHVLSPLALGEGPRVVRDVGLSMVSLFGMILVVMVGTSLLHKELERRSIFVLLSKPVGRSEYLLGKYAGLVAMLALSAALMTVAVFLADRWMSRAWHPVILLCGLATVVELMVLTSWTMVFSAVASPLLAGVFTLGCYVIGNCVADLRDLAALMPAGGGVLTWVSYALPNLYVFNFRAQVAAGQWPEASQLGFALMYGLLYCALTLTVATGLFRRREFA